MKKKEKTAKRQSTTFKNHSSVSKKKYILAGAGALAVIVVAIVVVIVVNFKGNSAPSLQKQFNEGSIVLNSPYLAEHTTDSGQPLWESGFLVLMQDPQKHEHISVYPPCDPDFYLPSLGTGNTDIEVEDADLTGALFSESEGDYTFYFYEHPYESRAGVSIGGKPFQLSSNSTQARDNILIKGEGFEAEWIRQYPEMADFLKEHNNIDIYDSFWDTHRLLTSYQCSSKDVSSDEAKEVYLFVRVNEDDFWQMQPYTNIEDTHNVQSIDQMLNDMNYQTLTNAIEHNRAEGTLNLLSYVMQDR